MENQKRKEKDKNALPREMTGIRALIDPYNDNNWYIFGSFNNIGCWYFNENENEQSFIKINDIPTQNKPKGHGCALFETSKNKNKYALIYGGDEASTTYNIYNLNKQKWIEIAIKNNPSKYGFGESLSMITDLFVKNKIHIIGGYKSEQKYGYFEFNDEIMDDCELS